MYGRYAAVRVDANEGFLFYVGEIDHLRLIWDVEFFKEDDDFPWVRALDWTL